MAINPAALNDVWWAVPVLLLSAVKNAVFEEVIEVGYLLERLEERGWAWKWQTLASAVLRGAYHLYQGIGPFSATLSWGSCSTSTTGGPGGSCRWWWRTR